MPGTERLEYEKEQGYYMCGINGCILAEHHSGMCVFPELSRQRSSREASPCATQTCVLNFVTALTTTVTSETKHTGPEHWLRRAKKKRLDSMKQ